MVFNLILGITVSMSQEATQKQTSAISTIKRQVGGTFRILHHKIDSSISNCIQ